MKTFQSVFIAVVGNLAFRPQIKWVLGDYNLSCTVHLPSLVMIRPVLNDF